MSISSADSAWGRPTPVVLVGCGAIAQAKYFPALQRLSDRLDVVAVVDQGDEARALGARAFPRAVAMAELPEDLSSLGTAAAFLLTPPEPRFEMTCRCLQAGLHILAEKPLAVTSTQALQLTAEAARRNRHLLVAHTRRWDPTFARLLYVLRGSRVQAASVITLETAFQPVVALAALSRDLPAVNDFERPVPEETAQAIGKLLGTHDERLLRYHRWVLIESVIHELDLLAHVLGPLQEVELCSLGDDAVTVTAVLRFRDSRATLQWTLAEGLHEYDQRFDFIGPGTRARLRYPSPFRLGAQAQLTIHAPAGDRTGWSSTRTVDSYDDAFHRLLGRFADDLRAGRYSQDSGQEAAAALRAAESLSRAVIAGALRQGETAA